MTPEKDFVDDFAFARGAEHALDRAEHLIREAMKNKPLERAHGHIDALKIIEGLREELNN